MELSRRTLLKTVAASSAMAVHPGGLAAVTGGAGAASSAASVPLYAVVSLGKAWQVFDNYHEAYRRAGELRITGVMQTAHVQCSPALAEQIRSGGAKSFVQIDGLAVTKGEADTEGLQFLRNAFDRVRARQQLVDHYRQVALERVKAHDRSMPYLWSYAQRDDGSSSGGL